MSIENTDFFYEGKIVPDHVKMSIYRMEDITAPSANKSVFENILTSLIEDLLHKKKISLLKVEKFHNQKVKHINTYVLVFQDENGNQFKCSYINVRSFVTHSPTNILASSIIFTFAKYGCKYCKFHKEECENCDRQKIEKIFPQETKSLLKHNLEEFEKMLGQNCVKSIADFCQGYCEYIRSTQTKQYDSPNVTEDNSIPDALKRIMLVDPEIIVYSIKLLTSVLGEYANNSKDIRNILAENTNVEKSFLLVIQHLQNLNMFVRAVKENPHEVPQEIVDDLENESNYLENNNDNDEENDDDDDDDDEGEEWKNHNDNT